MKRYLLATLLGLSLLAASPAMACTVQTIVSNGQLIVCTICCAVAGSCTSVCS